MDSLKPYEGQKKLFTPQFRKLISMKMAEKRSYYILVNILRLFK